jgi:uncharacterized protein YegP (UPF0339 family)
MFTVYRNDKNEWHWKLHSNDIQLGVSARGHKKRSAVLADVARIKKLVPDAGVVEVLG